jgi:hypothetical protein
VILAETLVAAFILAVGLLGLGALQVAAAAAATEARTRRIALVLVRNALEAVPGTTGVTAFDPEGREAGLGPAFFTVTVARVAGAGEWYRAEAAWTGGRRPGPRRLTLDRRVAP